MTAAVRRRLASASAESGWRARGAFGRAWLLARIAHASSPGVCLLGTSCERGVCGVTGELWSDWTQSNIFLLAQALLAVYLAPPLGARARPAAVRGPAKSGSAVRRDTQTGRS